MTFHRLAPELETASDMGVVAVLRTCILSDRNASTRCAIWSGERLLTAPLGNVGIAAAMGQAKLVHHLIRVTNLAIQRVE